MDESSAPCESCCSLTSSASFSALRRLRSEAEAGEKSFAEAFPDPKISGTSGTLSAFWPMFRCVFAKELRSDELVSPTPVKPPPNRSGMTTAWGEATAEFWRWFDAKELNNEVLEGACLELVVDGVFCGGEKRSGI